jgi:hypothetical protein
MFGFHPANLAFRFVLEIAALVAIGVGAYNLASGFFSWMLGIGLPLVAAVGWGTFNVPGDESRSGEAPVVVRGIVRLILELLFFATAVVLLWSVSQIAATVLGVGVVIHYLLSIGRIRWLLAN